MHIGHNHEDIDKQDLAIRHLGAGIIKEHNGQYEAALAEYQAAAEMDPELQVARAKIIDLENRMGNSKTISN